MQSSAISVTPTSLSEIAPLREAFRAEMATQIVHDSIHRRRGWTTEWAINEADRPVGYCSVAIDGPWRDRPTFYESFVVPERRTRSFAFFEAFLDAARPQAFDVQSDAVFTTIAALTFAREITVDRIVFREGETTTQAIPGATVRRVTPIEEIQSAIEARQGGGEWVIELDGAVVGRGGILFHYNVPFGDIYMEIDEPFRRRGLGAYLVHELKRACRELGAIPAARCNPSNVASRHTLQRAGFLPCAQILAGAFAPAGNA
jgi:GNAT superfamily N-acetyltransferase